MGGNSEARLWFGHVLTWSTAPGGPNLRQTRYAGREHVIERLGRLAADQHDVYPGWHLWRPATAAEYPGQLGGTLAPDLALARQLAEVRILTACPVYSIHGQPPSLFSVMQGSGPIQKLTVAGTTMLVVIRPDPTHPVIRFNHYDLTADPHMGTGALLAEIHAHIHRPADVSTEPVTIDWTAHTVHGPATGRTHPTWNDTYTDLLILLSGDLAPTR